jgi:hypothetical protein
MQNPVYREPLTDQELEVYKKLKNRIKELEQYIEYLSKEIPIKPIRQKREEAEKMLRANTTLLYFMFGEANLRQ